MELKKKKFLIVLVLNYVYKHRERHLYLNPREISLVTLRLMFNDYMCQSLFRDCLHFKSYSSLAVFFIYMLLLWYFL